MSPQFHETGYGKNFFQSQLPSLIQALEKIGDVHNLLADKDRELSKARERIKALELNILYCSGSCKSGDIATLTPTPPTGGN